MESGSLENIVNNSTYLDPSEMKIKLEDSIYSPDELKKKLDEIKKEGLESSRKF